MTPTTCPACDSPRQRAYSFRRSRTVVTCSSCGLRFVSPLPELEVLQHDVIESTAYSELTSETTQHLRELAVDIVAQLEQRLGGAGRLLDVGCGPGVLLSVARERGWQVTGLELSADSARRCQNAGLHVMPEPLEVVNLPEGSFDAVVLHHVLEHLPDPNASLRRCFCLLRPGGTLFIAVPNAGSWRARIQGADNGYVYQRDHLLFFRPANLERMVARHFVRPLRVETQRVGGRMGKRVAGMPGGKLLRSIVEQLGLGVEIRCWATKP